MPDAALVRADAAPDAPVNAPDGSERPPLWANRDRLLGTYFDYLRAHPAVTQTNGLSGASLTSVCDLWSQLDPSSQAVFLTLTARMQGSIVRSDHAPMLDHITRLYRCVGGQGATATDPGSCGGGEYNRMMMSMDPLLHDALVAANTDQGATPYDIADIPPTSFWRDSHDLAGPHAPFDLSDETNQGGPRGQVQYFRDPTSTAAQSPLGRQDLTTLVDPLAIEMDQDYDCTHNSNPLCSYTFYGPLCAPASTMTGVEIYSAAYGSIDPDWTPAGCR